jgi:hypothetical protein
VSVPVSLASRTAVAVVAIAVGFALWASFGMVAGYCFLGGMLFGRIGSLLADAEPRHTNQPKGT